MADFNNNNDFNNDSNNGQYGQYQGGFTPPPYSPYPPTPPKKKKPLGRGSFVAIVLVVCVVFSGAAGLGGAYVGNILSSGGVIGSNTDKTTHTPIFYKSVNVDTTGNISDVATVAASVSASVVEITTETAKTGGYFQQYIASGAGSGVIISQDGYIVTNNHVINGADTVTVRTNDGTEYPAKIIGTDSESDVAVIKIEAVNLSPAVIGDSDKLIVGQDVVAIGNPLGELGGTVTDGIISALDREITIDGDTMTLLQTNAAINPGNSGGGLFSLSRELIGIVNAKSSGSDIEGLGFAIPINKVQSVVEQILEFGYVKGRPYLGIETLEIKDYTTASYYRVNALGVYVISSNQNKELEAGDRITAIDGVEISTVSDIKKVLSGHAVGDVLKVTVSRKQKLVEVNVTCYEKVPAGKEVEFENQS